VQTINTINLNVDGGLEFQSIRQALPQNPAYIAILAELAATKLLGRLSRQAPHTS